jgi:hypothetical protein
MRPVVVLLILAVAIAPEAAAGQTRRLPAVAPPVPSASPASSPSLDDEWRLRGVILAGSIQFAVLQHGSTSPEQLVRVGDTVGSEVAVVSITADRIVLGGDGQTVTLRLAHGAEVAPLRPPNRARWAPAFPNARR